MQFVFDASTVDPSQSSNIAFPLGDYPVEIVKAEAVPTKTNPNVLMLVLTLKCLDGPMINQTQAYRLNIAHENEVTRRIAYQQLSAVCHAIGRLQIQDTQQLVGGRFVATIGPQDSDPKYSEVKKIKDLQGNEPMRQTAGTPAPAPPANTVVATVPTAPASPSPVEPAAPAAPAAAPTGFGAPAPAFGGGAPAAPPPPPWVKV